MLPVILKILCASAVLLAFLDCPMDANNAVIVVPMLSPNKIGIAPARPITLVTPSGPGCDAKFCSTAIVAELLCTTSVITAPSRTPSTEYLILLCHKFHKNRAVCKWLHNTSHDLNAFKQQTKRKNNQTNILYLFFLRSKVKHKANKNNRIYIVCNLKCHKLCSHCCTNIGTKNNRNCSGKLISPALTKPITITGSCRIALQHCCNQRLCQHSHNRIP